MEQPRQVYNLIIIFILTVASIQTASSSNQNLFAFTTTIDSTNGDEITVAWQPLSTTTLVYQDPTTNLPTSTSAQAEETLNSSDTNVLNRYARPYEHNDGTTEDDDPDEPPDHAIPHSEHEEARDVPTQPKYVAPGLWAKPPPDRNVPLDFVPTKLHAQVRGRHTVKRLPQRQAIENAKTDEERRNAPRLRKVVTNSKVNTVYTEEGYEDSAYDHAGHIRDADFHEGFARKLHDQKKSGQDSGDKEREKKNENLVPEEFKEYEEDYQDHFHESRNFDKTDDEDNLIKFGRSSWEESDEIDPKLVAENNIQRLEEDIEKDAEEAERSSKIHQNAQESKLRDDVKTDSSEFEASRVEDNSKHENKSIKTKKKKSKLRKGKDTKVNNKSNLSGKLKQTKKLRPENHGTTVLPFEEASLADVKTPTTPHGFVTSSPNPQIYSIDQTTLRYVAPIASASLLQVEDEPTVDYSKLFWDYFKVRQEPSTTESTLASNSTTMNPQREAQTPIAVATIDGHGPYLLVTREETMTLPPTFLDPSSVALEFGSTSPQTHSRHLLGQNDDVDYVDNVITTSTIATYTSVQPFPSLSPGDTEYSSSTTLVDTTVSSTDSGDSTPTVMTLNLTQEAYAKMADYQENPFLSPVLDNSKIVVSKNKLKYKVLARAPSREKKPVKSITHQSPRQQVPFKEESEYKKIRDRLNAKYNKMLSYIKNKQEINFFPKKKKFAPPEDFTPRRPPVQQVAYSIFLTDHPSTVNRSSAPAESESSRETNWRSPLQNQQHRPQSVKLPFRFDPFAHVQRPVYHKNSFPTTKLSPPLPLASTYANYRSGKPNDDRSHLGGKTQKRRDNAFKHLPLSPEANWRTRSRRKRSDEGEFRGSNGADVDVRAVANNAVTNDDKSEQRDKSTFDRISDRSNGKSSRGVIDAPIGIPNTMKLAFPARSREAESGTSGSKNSTVSERKNIKDVRETIDIPKVVKGGPISIRSVEQNERINDTDVAELTKKKRNSESEIYSTRNSKNERNHVELLNDSPKISGDVIDKEIAVRFNEGNNDTSKNTKSGKIEIEVPSFDHVDELATDDLVRFSTTTEAAVDLNKYPFYNNDDVPSASALKYIVDPKTIPRKTPSGMEFYNSRNAYKQCDEVEPHLDAVLPEKEEPDPERGPQEDLPRLRGLGEKLDCFKAKYFDDNPLDNPLFGEKLVEEPTPPTELNPKKFATKIMVLPDEDDDYVVPQVSKKPERNSRQTWRNRFRPYETLESIRVNYKHDPQTGRGRNAYLHSMRGTRLTNMMRRVKNRKPWPKLPTTTLSPKYQTLSYQNLVYEDVMGNIRNLKNAYQVYEMTTLPPAPQILVTAGSENALKIVDLESNSSKEKSTSKPNVTDVADATVANNTKSSEIKGLVPPPKYLIQRQSYRKHRPPAKNRVSLIRPSNFPRIIAHTIKIDKRSITDDDMKDYSESLINNNKKVTINGSAEVDAKNDTLAELTKKATDRTNATTELLDLEIEESRPISTQDRSLSVSLKIDDKKKQRNSTRSDLRSEPQKTVYTIRDRIRYSKPKWDTRGFGKFTANSTIDEDSRRKEPRYKSHRFERKKKLVDDRHNNSTIMNLTGNTSGIESAMSLTDGKDTSTTEVYHAEESAVQQMVYHKKDDYSEPEKAEDVDAESEEDFFKEDEGERTTNTYQVRENINENVSKAAKADPPPSKEVVDLREYLASDPPGYAEAFSEEATTPSGKYRANVNHESDGSEEKQEEETDDLRNVANPWDNYSSEKIEGQVETPMKTNLFSQDDDSAEHLSKEEGDSNKDQTFFTYPKRPSLIEGDEDDDKATFYKPFPFSRYKSMIKKENEENEENSEEEQKKSEDYVFPWHADKENPDDKRRWLYKLNRYEYPWERRDRLAREQKQYKVGIFDDENEEESTRYERPIYPWERYNVPSKNYKVNTRRDTSRRYIDDSEESSTEHVPSTKFSSRYSSSSMKPSQFSNAREISRSIKRFLEEDDDSKEKTSTESESRSPSFARKSLPSSDKGISRGTLVPEDVTQPPRRKSPRRRILPVDKSVSKNSRFDSKKLRSEDVDEEKEEEHTEYLNKSILNEPAEVTSSQPSQLSNGTEGVPFATEQHKKRRRRILKTNSTISLDNASAESTIKPKKKRRKLEASTTTSTTPSTSVDFSLKESISTPVRKRYPKRDEKTNRSNHSGKAATNKIIVTPGTSKAVNFQETSTPKTRTIEHRSRVSKEKIVTKTTYPDKTKNFDSMKTTNLTSTQTGPVKSRIKSRRRNNNNSTMNSNNEDSGNKKELIKQERKNHEAQFVNEDEIKKSVISDKPQERNKDSASGSFEIKKEEEAKKINNFDTYDGNVNDESDNGNGGFGISSEVYAVRNLMQNIPPNRKRNRVNERTESESDRIIESWKDQNNNEEANKEEKEREEDVEQKQKPLLQAKFIKDPEHRLYYYVERK